MYIVAVILIGVLVLVTLYLDHYIRRRRIKRWFASQPPEVIISGRKRVAERARALLQEQIECYAFMNGVEQSQDPEIQKLIAIVAEVLQEGNEDDFPDWVKDSMKEQILVLERTTVKT
jgi:hypothetical protein